MTAPTKVAYNQVLLKIGDGASPETFAQPCLINGEKALEFSATFSDEMIPDCSDGSLPAAVLRHAESIQFTGTGSGKLHQDSVKDYLDKWAAGQPINAIIEIGTADATGATELSCQIVITGFRITAQRSASADCEISIASHNFQSTDIAALTS